TARGLGAAVPASGMLALSRGAAVRVVPQDGLSARIREGARMHPQRTPRRPRWASAVGIVVVLAVLSTPVAASAAVAPGPALPAAPAGAGLAVRAVGVHAMAPVGAETSSRGSAG